MAMYNIQIRSAYILFCIPVYNLWLVACNDLCTRFVEECGGVMKL